MRGASEFLAGLVFGLGLLISGMTDPGKVKGFLDLAGAWDPSLALVMGGAVLTAAIGFALARRRHTSLLGLTIHRPAVTKIDRQLLAGGLVFGAGWGLSGFCPGPAVLALWTGEPAALVFVAAMLAGMGLVHLFARPGAADG